MEPESAAPPPSDAVCANCAAPLYGKYCYACGQPAKGMIRHLSGALGDVLDTVLNIDSRVVHTIPALYFKPGLLSCEYFAGRRVRYVTPFRLMFFLALAAFFVMQLAVNDTFSTSSGNGVNVHVAGDFDQAKTPQQVKARERKALGGIDAALASPHLPAVARASMEVARGQVLSAAAERIAELKRASKSAMPAGTATLASPATVGSAGNAIIETDHGPAFPTDGWSAAQHPLHVNWWPDWVNVWLNSVAQHAHDNFALAFRSGDSNARRAAWQHIITGMFSVLPQTMFVLIPLFALILKLFYILKRRLYMEHLIVALHSHAFIFLSILVLLGLAALKSMVNSAWLSAPLALTIAAAWVWLFVYLWLMQKRVYAQGWILTTLKYWCVGICHSALLAVALTIALLLSLVSA